MIVVLSMYGYIYTHRVYVTLFLSLHYVFFLRLSGYVPGTEIITYVKMFHFLRGASKLTG